MRSLVRPRTVLILLFAASTADAQAPPVPKTSQTLAEIQDAARIAAAADAISTSTPALLSTTVSIAPASPPDPFAQRLHAAYQDFFSALSFAINSVKETSDGQALVIRFTPRGLGPLQLATSVTATKAILYGPVSEALPVEVRASVSDDLRRRLSDFDDVAYSVSVAPSPTCDPDTSSVCFGKNAAAYRDWLSAQLLPLVPKAPLSEAAEKELEPLEAELAQILLRAAQSGPSRQPTDTTLEMLLPDDKERAEVLSKQIGRLEATGKGIPLETEDLETYARLLDNQPQLSVIASYRSRDTLCGPDEFSATLEYQVGGKNINSLRRRVELAKVKTAEDGPSVDSLLKSWQGKVSQARFVLTASYKRRTSLRLSSVSVRDATSGSTAPSEQEFPLNIDEPSSDEFSARAQWGVDFGTFAHLKRPPRFDVSGEAFVTHKDSVREKNRLVVAATLTVPLGDSAAIPVSISWANKSEYLIDQRRQWGAHVGVSYRLPWEAK